MDNTMKTKIDAYLERSKGAILEDLKTLVRIRSVSDAKSEVQPYGQGCRDVLDKALSMAKAKGFATENGGYRYGLAFSGEGKKTLGIFSHVDVVPEGNGWIYSPYEPLIKDGCIIGRGTADDKMAVVIGMYVMDCIRTLGLPVKSRIELYMGCAEETGMDDIVHFRAEQPMPDFSIVPDSSFPVCHGEKGIMDVEAASPAAFEQISSFTGGFVGNMVTDHAEARIPMNDMLYKELVALAKNNDRITLSIADGVIVAEARGVASHASMPEGSVNATRVLAAFLAGARALSPSDAALLAQVARILGDDYGEELGIAFTDAPSGRLTCISGLSRTLPDGRLKLAFDIRYPVTDRGERVSAAIRSYFAAHRWEVLSVVDSAPCYIPADDPKITQLCDIYAALTGEDATPYVMGGGTYARYLSNAVSFGPNGDESKSDLPDSLGLPAGHGGVHQPDEAFRIDRLLNAIRIYVMAMVELDKIVNA